MDSEDTHLREALWKQVAHWRVGKLTIKKFTPLGLPYLFKRNQFSGKAWCPSMPSVSVGADHAWVDEGNTTEQECALWIDHYFSKYNPIGYYGA